MESEFKEYLRYFLRRYGVPFCPIDFDTITSANALLKQPDLKAFWNPLIPIDISTALTLIFDLHQKGIYLYQSDYQTAEAYPAEKDQWVYDKISGAVSIENYIERFLLDETVKKAIYQDKSKYAMGNPHELKPPDRTTQSIAREIVQRYFWYPDITDDEFKKKTREIEKNFHRKGRFGDRLKTDLGFDLEAFDQTQYSAEICKILYFIYEMENEKIPKLLNGQKKKPNLVQFIKNLSMESVDNSVLGQEGYEWETPFGKITRLVKHTLEKELTLSAWCDICFAFNCVIESWNDLLKRVLQQMDYNAEHDGPSLIIERIRKWQRRNSADFDISNHSSATAVQESPIARFYFLVCRQETLGDVRDAKKIINMPIEANYEVAPKVIETMRRWDYERIALGEVRSYLKEHADNFIEYVYFEETLDKEELARRRRGIRDSIDKVVELLNILALRKCLPINNEIQILKIYVISCLQAVLIDNNDVDFEYTCYGLGGGKPKKVDNLVRKKDKRASDALSSYWVQKIEGHKFANLGRYEMFCEYKKFEDICYDIEMEILSAPCVSDMRELHQAYYESMRRHLSVFLD